MLYIYDRVAWVGTDDFLANHSQLKTQAGGFVVTGDHERTDLVFYDRSHSRALYRARFEDLKMIESGLPAQDRQALTPMELRLIAARDSGLKAFQDAKAQLCGTEAFNVAAIPPSDPSGPVLVYLMTPQTEDNSYPMGGHSLVEVRADGSTGQVRGFTKSCIAFDSSEEANGAAPVAMFITHLLDPTPTEIHVFTSLASKKPIYVSTQDGRTWIVDGASIESAKSD